MKLTYTISALCVVAAIFMITSAVGETSTYATFTEASVADESVQVVGTLVKHRPITYDPQVNPNYFSFFVRDADGEEREVVLTEAKPQDFEMSEQIVVTGSMRDGRFLASDLLMKCPSKYKDEMVALREQEG